jgi:hypothetical protein
MELSARRLAYVVASVLATSAVAFAQSPTEKATAESLFQQGKALVEKKNFVDACPKFEESLRVDPSLGTQYYLADCYEHTARTASAWANFLEVANKAKATGEKAKESKARERATALESKVAHLTIAVAAGNPPGLEVKRGTTVVGSAQWGVPIAIDAGTYPIVASAKGKQEWTHSIAIVDGASVTETIPVLDNAASGSVSTVSSATPSSTASASNTVPPHSDTPPTERTWQKPTAWVLGGVGLVAMGVGGYFALSASSKNSDSKGPGLCDENNKCTPAGASIRDAAVRRADTATVLFAAGGLVAATGLVLWLTAPSGGSLQPSVGLSPNGLIFKGTFQ